MQQNASTNSDPNNGEYDKVRPQSNVVWTIAAAGIAGVLIILFVSILWSNLIERTKFFTTNALSVLLLDVIVVQAYIYRKQWEAMQDSLKETRRGVDVAEENAIYANRAYVTAKIKGNGWFVQDTIMLQFRLQIENSGNTPANNVCVSYSYELLENPPYNDRGFMKTERLGVIAPNGAHHVIDTPDIEYDTREDHSRVKLLYCWGRITYEDIFNEGRSTDFCCVQSLQGQVDPWEHGNEAI